MKFKNLSTNEKLAIAKMASRWAKKAQISEATALNLIEKASFEVHQKMPFTTLVIKKAHFGKVIVGAGFAKYNMNDAKMTKPIMWSPERGRIIALRGAVKTFMEEYVIISAKPMKEVAPATPVATATDKTVGKRRGRPVGSKKKVQVEVSAVVTPAVAAPITKKRGRPVGSKNKKTVVIETPRAKRGRPLGRKDSKKRMRKATKAIVA